MLSNIFTDTQRKALVRVCKAGKTDCAKVCVDSKSIQVMNKYVGLFIDSESDTIPETHQRGWVSCLGDFYNPEKWEEFEGSTESTETFLRNIITGAKTVTTASKFELGINPEFMGIASNVAKAFHVDSFKLYNNSWALCLFGFGSTKGLLLQVSLVIAAMR